MFSKAIKGLFLYRDRRKLSHRDRAQAREHIRELFMAGFSPAEIMFFAGGKDSHWKLSTIKKYCSGLEVKNTKMKERTLQLLQEYVIQDGDWDELESYVNEKKMLKKENIGFDELLAIKQEIDARRIDFDSLAEIGNQLFTRNISWVEFIEIIKTLMNVLGLGYTEEDLALLHEKTLAYGGMRGLVSTIQYAIMEKDALKTLQEMNTQADAIHADSEAAMRMLEETQYNTRMIQGHADFARVLIDEHHIDPLSFRAILETARKYGEPMNILQAINTYANLNALLIEFHAQTGFLQGLNDTIKKYQKEASTWEDVINELHRRIGAIEEQTRHNRALQNIANLLTQPTQATLGPIEFMLLAQAIFLGIRAYALTHRLDLPLWTLAVEDQLERIVSSLNKVISDSNGKTS